MREYAFEIDTTENYEFFYNDDLRHQYNEIILEGSRGGGKTIECVQGLVHIAITRRIRIYASRETQAEVRELKNAFEDFIYEKDLQVVFEDKLEKFFDGKKFVNINNTEIKFYNGSVITLTFINDNVVQRRKSLTKAEIFWVEEAKFITEYTHSILLPTIRGGKHPLVIYTFNPEKEDDFIYAYARRMKDEKAVLHRIINWRDNPYFPKHMNKLRLREKRTLTKGMYRWKWEGECKNFNDEAVIDTSKIGRFDDSQKYTYDYMTISMDTAYSTKESADFSVIIVAGGLHNGSEEELHILRVMRGRWEFNDLIQNLLLAHRWCNESYGYDPDRILIENKASGQSLIQEVERLTSLYISKIKPSTDKYTRVCEVLPFIVERKLKVPLNGENPLNSWIKPFMLELEMFRADNKHEHDDQVDALTQLISDYQKNKPVDWGSVNW